MWASGEGGKKACKHETKTLGSQTEKNNINYKSTQGQRSTFLPEEKFGMKQGKKKSEVRMKVGSRVNKVTRRQTRQCNQSTARHTVHSTLIRHGSKGQITGYEYCLSFLFKCTLLKKKNVFTQDTTIHTATDTYWTKRQVFNLLSAGGDRCFKGTLSRADRSGLSRQRHLRSFITENFEFSTV